MTSGKRKEVREREKINYLSPEREREKMKRECRRGGCCHRRSRRREVERMERESSGWMRSPC